MKISAYASLITLLVSCYQISAQTPGGVGTSLTLWIKAGSGTSTTGSLLNSWTYQNDGTKSFTGTGGERPVLNTNVINFAPAVTFNSSLMDGPIAANAPIAASDDDYCLFAVWRSTSGSTLQRIWTQRDPVTLDNADGFSLATWNNGTYGNQLEKNPFDQAMLVPYTANKWNISHLNLLNATTNDLEMRDQTTATGIPVTITTAGTGASTRNLAAQLNRLGARNNSTDEPLTGDLAELIIYNSPVTNATTRNQIYSYLAFKYGITKQGDLLASNGTTVYWNSTANATYQNSVFGIGRDNTSGLLLTQANSVETGNGDGSGQPGLGNILLSAASIATDLSFLAVGNDAGALTVGTAEIPTTAAGSSRLAREWKVQQTGTVGTVDLSMDFNGITGTGTAASDFRLMVDQDGNGDFQSGTIRYYTPSSYNVGTGRAIFTGVTLNNGEIFSFITNASAILPVTWKSFTAVPSNGNIKLNWKVENNENAKSYEITHSLDGANFTKIADINNSPSVKSYDYTYSPSTSGKHYFRILQSDFDGKSIYSKIVSADIQSADYSVRLLNNPLVNNFAELEVRSVKSTNALVEVWSVSGAKISSRQQLISTGTSKLNVNIGSAGNYILKVKIGNITLSEQIIKL